MGRKTEEPTGTGSAPAQGEASPPAQVPSAEPVQPPEPPPVGPSQQADILALQRRLAQTEGELRGLQSVVDKSAAQQKRIQELVGGVDAILAAQVRDGALEELEASRYRQQAQLEAIYAQQSGEPEPVDDGGVGVQQQPAQDPYQLTAEVRLRESGLVAEDPEMAMLANQPDPFAWAVALEEAKTAKAARLAREQAAITAAQVPGAPETPPQQTPAQTGATAVESGGAGGAGETAGLGTLRSQFTAALRSGDRDEMARLSDLIDKETAASG